MSKISKIKIASGVYWVEVPEAKLYVLCGCPADSVKHLMKAGKIRNIDLEIDNSSNDSKHHTHGKITNETGPNAILLSDLSIQNGDFANLAEFPVLQMLYRQGMLLPNHPNNTGAKPLLIGRENVVNAQMNYIHRGNYGLINIKEILETGIPKNSAEEMMRIKNFFAFGKIHPSTDLLEARIVEDDPIEVLNGVDVSRKSVNRYEFHYKNERVEIDLNLEKNESYETPYQLGNHRFKREYFSVVHTGEGDGWDINRPCMASVICFQGKIYLIDVGPNISHTLNAIGVDVNEVEGIFHTHAHDDHFAGLTTLIRSNHRIKYYSTPMVRSSVSKKLSALMSISENSFEEFFEVCDLKFLWNNINGLEVRPVFSPHPVETNILFFRTIWENGYSTYAHLADVASHDVLKKMVEDDLNLPGISKKLMKQVWGNYLSSVHVKKIDIGGGIIHGNASDFKKDKSKKIILAHTAHELTQDEKMIGCGVTFGSIDTMVEGNEDYEHELGSDYLRGYYPKVSDGEIHMMLNCERESVDAGNIFLKDEETPEHVCLILTGVAELISPLEKNSYHLSSGSLVGDLQVLFGSKSKGTYRALSHIEILKIPSILFKEFVNRNNLLKQLKKTQNIIEFLKQTWLFGESISSPIQSQIAQQMSLKKHMKGKQIKTIGLMMVKEGQVRLNNFDKNSKDSFFCVGKGDFWGGEKLLGIETNFPDALAISETSIYSIKDIDILKNIPIIRWKLMEQIEKHE